MTVTDELVANAQRYAASFDKGDLPMAPAHRAAIVCCMDARVNPYGIFGLTEGDAHVIRNAGGAVTDDTVRSLAISQRLLGTEEVLVVHHADCGMRSFSGEDFHHQIFQDTGVRPPWAVETFSDSAEDVRQSIARIRANPFLPRKDSVRGFVYNDHTGQLQEVAS
ncbi:MAG TPA: carbonic anhydrase [Acidimicrobiales bacterium]|jgi:carbonic anhydrase|nr:carbonic anhydrase [Acidimicrobiales bacterium]